MHTWNLSIKIWEKMPEQHKLTTNGKGYLCVTLTLNLKEGKDEHTMPMKGKRLCKYCRELAEKVSQERSLDMAFLDERVHNY